MLFHLLFLDEFLQEGLREFKAVYSPPSIPATFSLQQGILGASVPQAWYSRRVVKAYSSCGSCCYLVAGVIVASSRQSISA